MHQETGINIPTMGTRLRWGCGMISWSKILNAVKWESVDSLAGTHLVHKESVEKSHITIDFGHWVCDFNPPSLVSG